MKKLIVACLLCWAGLAWSYDTTYFSYGPISLNIPLKTTSVVYLYDFHQRQNLVGGETPVITGWNRVEGTVGGITSLQGAGTPFIGGKVLIGNVLHKYLTLPMDLKLGGLRGWNFRLQDAIYGLKTSIKLW